MPPGVVRRLGAVAAHDRDELGPLGALESGPALALGDVAEKRDEVEIVGSAGSLTFSSFGTEPVVLRTADGERRIDAPYPEVVQQPLIQTVVDELTGHGTCPSTGASALRTARFVDTVLAVYRAEHGITF